MKRGRKKVLIILGILLCAAVVALVFFNIPYSPTKTEFNRLICSIITETDKNTGVISGDDIAGLPTPLQDYFRDCGYIGIPKMTYAKVVYHDVDFWFSEDNPKLKIDYTQYNFTGEPTRVAYIDSSLYGIPFEGLDAYADGHGSMKGVIAKLHTLFDQSGEAMDKASLVTYLSECLLIPSVALEDYIIWQEIDDTTAKATLSYYGETVSGIFTFDPQNETVTFTTDDRTQIATDGTTKNVTWCTVSSDYQDANGIKKPTGFKAIWKYATGDLVYFDGKGQLIYDTEE